MSKALYNLAASCSLRHPVKAVLKEMCWFGDDYGNNIWPSVETLARRTGLTGRAVQMAIRKLEAMGFVIALGPKLGGHRHETVRYRVVLSTLQADTSTGELHSPVTAEQHSPVVKNGPDGCTTFTPRVNEMSVTGEQHSPKKNLKVNEKKISKESPLVAPLRGATCAASQNQPQTLSDEKEKAVEKIAEFLGGPQAIKEVFSSWKKKQQPRQMTDEEWEARHRELARQKTNLTGGRCIVVPWAPPREREGESKSLEVNSRTAAPTDARTAAKWEIGIENIKKLAGGDDPNPDC